MSVRRSIIRTSRRLARVKELEKSLDKQDKLKTIEIMDIERPDKYDNQVAKFNTWFDTVKDLMTSRGWNWEFMNSFDDAIYKCIKEQSDTHAKHLKKLPENLQRWRAPHARDQDRL